MFKRKRKILAQLLSNNIGGNPRQRLLDGAPGYLPLLHTVVPTRGALTPAFSRATTETGQKYDSAGYLDFTALSGEVIFKGAMRVRNLVVNSGTLTAAGGWTVANATSVIGATDPEGGSTAYTFTATGVGGLIYCATGITAGRIGQGSWYIKRISGTGVVRMFGPDNGGERVITVTSSWSRLSDGAIAASGTSYTGIDVTTSGDVVALWCPMAADITGETDQTTIRPYVSVGVLSSPFQGAFVDGVQYFPYDLNGNAIPRTGSYPLVGYVPWEARTNICLQSNAFTTTWTNIGTPAATQNAIGPDGATSAWTLTDNAAGASEGITQAGITTTAASWTFSFFVAKTVGAQAAYPVCLIYTGTTGLGAVTVDTSNGVATAWTAYTGFTGVACVGRCTSFNSAFWRVEIVFTGTAASWTIQMFPAGTTNATQSTGLPDVAAQGSAVFYGAQVELGPFATPYIPTTTVAVARNADILTYTGAEIANYKAMACTFSRGVGVSNVGVMLSLSDCTVNNYAEMYLLNATAMKFEGQTTGPTTQWSITASNAYAPGASSKVSQTWATNSEKADKDGTAQTADTVVTPPVVSDLGIGHIAGSFVFNGPVTDLYFWTRNLSQSELGAVDR